MTVHTTLNVTGKPAQFGRGVMTEVGGKLIGIFATNLADMLSSRRCSAAGRAAAGGCGRAADPETAADPRPSPRPRQPGT